MYKENHMLQVTRSIDINALPAAVWH